MQFLYDAMAGCENLKIINEAFFHLKARRAKVGERVNLRNLKDGKDYLYEIEEFGRKDARLRLVFTSTLAARDYGFSLAWAVVDPKTIEKTIPFLNELGVGKLIFVYTKFSQANFKIDVKRLEYISALSCEQCGRGSLMSFEIYKNLDEFLAAHKDVALVNFGGKNLAEYKGELLFIGPEGGFALDETRKINSSYSLDTNSILRSQTAAVSVASKFLV